MNRKDLVVLAADKNMEEPPALAKAMADRARLATER